MGSGGVSEFSAERMRIARARSGLSYRQLAPLVGVSATTLFSYETGRARPRPPKLRALAEALGCKTSDLAPLPANPSLRDYREHAGMFLRDVATSLGVSDTTVLRMEDGTHWPDDPERWAAAYGLTLKGFAEAWRPS